MRRMTELDRGFLWGLASMVAAAVVVRCAAAFIRGLGMT